MDASSLLWRIELAGGDVGDRWLELAELWVPHTHTHVQAFNGTYQHTWRALAPDMCICVTLTSI